MALEVGGSLTRRCNLTLVRIDPSIDPRLDPRFQALSREASVAAECMATGATLLGKVHASQEGIYNQAFFNLSIGLERAAKLAFVLDHCFDNAGAFPSDKALRDYGHDLRELLDKADEISKRRRAGLEYFELPRGAINLGIIETLSEFAEGTRYYNLDYLVRGKGAARSEPINAWYERVGKPILAKHYKPRQRAKHQAQAAVIAEFMDEFALVMHHTEAGATINSLSEGFLHSNETAVIRQYSRMYSLQIVRFFAFLISDLSDLSYRSEYRFHWMPHMSDFFGILFNNDRYFLNRKTWSIHNPKSDLQA